MKVSFEGREWDLDVDDVDVKQATVLYLTYKMTLREWIEGLGDADQRSLHFTYWLMLQQNGVVRPIADCNPKIFAFAAAFAEGQDAETAAAEPEAAPDPTRPSLTASPESPTSVTPMTTTPPLLVPAPVSTAS